MNERQVKMVARYRKQYQEDVLDWKEFGLALDRLRLSDEEFISAQSFTHSQDWCRIARKEARNERETGEEKCKVS